jgi:hypothetical protein
MQKNVSSHADFHPKIAVHIGAEIYNNSRNPPIRVEFKNINLPLCQNAKRVIQELPLFMAQKNGEVP